MNLVGTILLIAPILLFSMVAHEYAHGYAALKQGDPTAYQLGRLTWNPVRHIDPFMTIILPLILIVAHAPIIGGAKPVPVNPRNYRRYKRGDIIVSLAGVATNLVIAVLCVPLFVLAGALGHALPALAPSLALLQVMLTYGVMFNLLLVLFNLIPIPPLDGSHVVKHLLPPAWSLRYQQVGRFGLLILILLLLWKPVVDWWLWPVSKGTQLLLAPAAAFHLSGPIAL
ncbi:MAG TPA: site-2 protease family protein [Gemmatimonadaceae bacterium]|nr:site-2 protease family protein [Gemmatimonadaceae bacterium]